jgi:hypothetical protein
MKIGYQFNNLAGKVNIKIYNSNGALLLEAKGLKSDERINTTDLPKGQLILRIELPETKRKFTYKLIKSE